MLKKGKLPSYADGIIAIYREKPNSTSFGAKINASSVDDMDLVVTLAYSAQSIRERDFDFAEQMGFNLSAKVKTHFVRGVDSDCKAVIENNLYDISYIDKTKTEMFFYLEGGVPLVDSR